MSEEKEAPFRCPQCGTSPHFVLMFVEGWKCSKGHVTPHSKDEVKRLDRLHRMKSGDYQHWQITQVPLTYRPDAPTVSTRRADID